MASCVDDFRVGQRKTGETDQWEIVRHLIGKEGFVRDAMTPGSIHIFFPQCAPVTRVEFLERVWKANAVGAISADAIRDLAQLGEFGCTFDLAVACEYLFNQRGPRSWQADDENRIRCVVAIVLMRANEFFVKYIAYALVAKFLQYRVVADEAALFLITRVIEIPGLVIVLAIFVGLAERKAKMHIRHVRQTTIFQLRFHGRNFIFLEFEYLEVGHAPIRFAQVRFEFDRLSIRGQCRRLIAERLQRVRQAHIRLWESRRERYRL